MKRIMATTILVMAVTSLIFGQMMNKKPAADKRPKAAASNAIKSGATIKLTFNGLLVFTFDEAQRICEIGVLKAKGHVLRIKERPELTEKLQTGNISIGIPGRNGLEGVTRFEALSSDGKTPRPFSRREGVDDPKDFRWAIDLEGAGFHNRELPLKHDFPPQSIIVRQGMFYTDKLIPVSQVLPNKRRKEIKIASPVGYTLHLNEGEKFVLSYGRAGEKLEITAAAGATHEMTILNTPERLPKAHDEITHFPHFYECVVEVPAGEEFGIERSKKLPPLSHSVSHRPSSQFLPAPFGDPDRPCPFVVLGKKTKGLPTPAQNAGQD